MKKVAIVIPNYKESLNQEEIISLVQCRKILGQYDRYFVIPKGMKTDYVVDESVHYVNGTYLSSRKKYSEFVLSEEFYELFENYEFILIYQLDSFVFEDRLLAFCDMKYDYIGAKWPYGLECYVNGKSLWYYGNGGFSLRRVAAFLNWIKTEHNLITELKSIIPEDLVISIYGGNRIRVAEEISLDFSFDLNPIDCFGMNGGRLPFGCHAWHKFDRDFWMDQIESFGYTIKPNREVDKAAQFLSDGKDRKAKIEKYFDVSLVPKCIKCLLPQFEGKLYVFGAGQYGFSFMNMAKRTDIHVVGFIDNDPEKRDKSICGIGIRAMKDVMDIGKVPILIALSNPELIVKQLEEMGLIRGRHFIASSELQKEMIRQVEERDYAGRNMRI